MPADDKELTELQAAFCDEYLVDLNAGAAYKRAGGSAASARQLGPELLKDSRIKARVAAAMDERAKATRVVAYKVLEELAVIALSSVEHYEIDDKGNVTLAPDAPIGAMRAVSKIRRKVRVLERNVDLPAEGVALGTSTLVEYETELTLWDKNPAVTTAMKHLGLVRDRVEHTGANGGPMEFTPGWDLSKLSLEQLRDLDGIAASAGSGAVA